MDSPARMAYWLLPAEPYFSELCTFVTNLAGRFDGPEFVPHVTIYYGAFHPDDPVEAIISRLSEFSAPELTFKDLSFSDLFTQTCVARFEPSSEHAEMNSTVRSLLTEPDTYEIDAHMSLLYGVLLPRQRDVIREELSIPKQIKFDRVTAIANQRRTTTAEDVRAWREVARATMKR